MRTWGRVYALNPDGSRRDPQPTGYPFWQEVTTTADGFDDLVWLTTLLQVLKLNLGESPFYANYGIPAKPSVIQQVMPDFYVARTQAQFAGFFAALTIAKVPSAAPTYKVNVITHQGVNLSAIAQVPQ